MKSSFFILFSLALVAVSCNKDIQKSCECEKGIVKNFNLDLKLENLTINKSVKYWQKDSLTLTYTSVEQQDFEKVIQSLKTNDPLNEPYAIVLYLNTDFDESDQIRQENIIAFSSYSINKDYLYHKLFFRKMGTFNLSDEYTCTVENVRSNDNNMIAGMFINTLKKPISWILLYSESTKPVHFKSPHQLGKILNNNLKAGPFYDCDVPCSGSTNEPCEWTPMNGYDCSNGTEDPCLESTLNGIVIDGGLNFDQTVFNYTLHNKFKDDVLSQSATGQQLINDYYQLGAYFIPKMNLNVATQTYNILPLVNTIIGIILDHKSEIAISTANANQIKNLIDIYIALSDSPEITSKLVSYKNLVDNYTNINGNQIVI